MSFYQPFGGWSSGGQGGPSQPSIFGALPYVSDPAHPNMLTFFFIDLNPDILNCNVVNGQAKRVFQIVNRQPDARVHYDQERGGAEHIPYRVAGRNQAR